MKGSMTIARIRGVPLRLHWSFILVLALIGFAVLATTGSVRMVGYAVGLIAIVFVFVLIHELAHVAVARRFGIPTREITLLPIGGISHMERMPEEPRREAAISIAGPLTNVGFAILLAPLVWHFHGGLSAFMQVSLIDPTSPKILIDMFWLNVIMGAFNLLPAFPLDGGRVLRALLAVRMSYVRATKVAADVGKMFGILFALVGLLVINNIFLAIIGVFVYFGAAAEERAATALAVFRRAHVKEAMRAEFTTVAPDQAVAELVEISFRTRQSDFPVVDGGRCIGIVDRSALGSAAGHGHYHAADVMVRRFPRIHPEDDLGKAFEAFRSGDMKAIPVFERTTGGATGATRIEDLHGTIDHASASAAADGALDGRLVALLTVEDMERAFVYITQRESIGPDTRVASPLGRWERKRRVSAPRAHHTRAVRTGDGGEMSRPTVVGSAASVSDGEPEVWVPVPDEEPGR